MSTFNSPADATPFTRAYSAQLNALDAATAAAFALLPDETRLKNGTVQYAVDTGTVVNAYLVALPYTPASYTDGMRVTFRPIITNTGAATINVNSLGVKSIRQYNGAVLGAGDVTAGCPLDLMYSSTTGFFHRTGSGPAGATGATGPAGSISGAANGSAAAPSIAFNSEATGLYLAASGRLGISVTGIHAGMIEVHATPLSSNLSLGPAALKALTTGVGNIAVGAQSLPDNTIGDYNIAIGATTMNANVSGRLNVAVGVGALSSLTSGEGNVVVGQAMASATSGDYNVAIGTSAGAGDAAGNRNTWIGVTAGGGSGFSYSTAIGFGAQTTKSYQMVFGHADIIEYLLPGTAAHFKYAGSFSSSAPVTVTDATYTVLLKDSDLIANRAGTVTLTLPAAATYPGRELAVKTIQAQTVVSASSNVVPRAGGAAGTAILAATAGNWARLKSNGTAWEIMSGS